MILVFVPYSFYNPISGRGSAMNPFFIGVPGMFISYRVKVPKALYSREL
jgi:hypothetical protein